METNPGEPLLIRICASPWGNGDDWRHGDRGCPIVALDAAIMSSRCCRGSGWRVSQSDFATPLKPLFCARKSAPPPPFVGCPTKCNQCRPGEKPLIRIPKEPGNDTRCEVRVMDDRPEAKLHFSRKPTSKSTRALHWTIRITSFITLSLGNSRACFTSCDTEPTFRSSR